MLRECGGALSGIILVTLAGCGGNGSDQAAPSAPAQETTATAPPVEPACSLTMGWDPWEPYQYKDDSGTVRGLDVDLVRAIASSAECELSFEEGDWASLLARLREGEIDLLTGATRTGRREAFAYFTEPYRDESFALYVRAGEAQKFPAGELRELLESAFRVGVTDEYVYGDAVTALQDDPSYEERFHRVAVGEANYAKLINSEIDGFLEDPFVAATVLRRKGLQEDVETHPLEFPAGEVSLMLSRASVEPATVERLNAGLSALRTEGTHQAILAKYLR